MVGSKIIISKDALFKGYLPTYGNTYWKTPNIDDLAFKGTVFNRHYAAAPSTVMSFFSSITGKYGHETSYELYEKRGFSIEGETLFTKAQKLGYKNCHAVFDEKWRVVPKYFNLYRGDVSVHYLDGFRQGVGPHYLHDGALKPDKKKEDHAFCMVEDVIKSVAADEGVFLWIHFPHVINGRTCYGGDIDLFDRYVGMIRKYFPDESIYITADHGNMNGLKGKLGYGYDVYEPSINIPFIAPRMGNASLCSVNTSNTNLYELVFEGIIPRNEFVYSDSAYRAQENRKIAIIKGDYKLIFNKKNGRTELYDLKYDPREDFSLMNDYIYDSDRKLTMPIRDEYFYTRWDGLLDARAELTNELERIWRNGSIAASCKDKLKNFIKPLYCVARNKYHCEHLTYS